MNKAIKNPISTNLFFLSAAFCGLLIFITCSEDTSSTSPLEDEIETARVVIEPKNASFEVNEELDFSAFVISASGDTMNDELNIKWNWYSSDTDVLTVQSNGTATGHNSGEAYCIVEATTETGKIAAKLRFVGRDSAFVLLF